MSIFDCIVCHENYMNSPNCCEGVVWSRKCGHVYHKVCLIQWLTACRFNNRTTCCPKCGLDVVQNEHIQQLYNPPRPNIKRPFEIDAEASNTARVSVVMVPSMGMDTTDWENYDVNAPNPKPVFDRHGDGDRRTKPKN